MARAADVAATRPALARLLTMRVMLSALRTGEGVEGAMLTEVVARSAIGVLFEVVEVAAATQKKAEVAMAGGAP